MRCSSDLRKRVVQAVSSGLTKYEVARRYNVGVASVYRWLRAADACAYRLAGPRGAHKLDRDKLLADVKARPDATQAERARLLGVAESSVWYTLKKLGITRKKNVAIS